MLASSTSKTVPSGPTQSNVGATDPNLAVIMATLARMEEQTRKRKGNPGGPEESKYRKGGPHKGRGGGGGRSTTNTQGGGRGRGNNQTTAATTEHNTPTIPKWKLNNPQFLTAPTDGKNIAYVKELKDYRFYCTGCEKWCKHTEDECPMALAKLSQGLPIARVNNTKRNSGVTFAAAATLGNRESVIDNDYTEPEPGQIDDDE